MRAPRSARFLAMVASLFVPACVPVLMEAPPPADEPGEPPAPPAVCPPTFAQRTLDDINAARRDRGLPRLRVDVRLERAAALHAADLAEHGGGGHRGSDGSGVEARVEREGYDWRFVAENVAVGQPTPEAAVASWMASPGHRQNILDPAGRHVGVAHVRVASGFRDYWVAVFGDALDGPVVPHGGCTEAAPMRGAPGQDPYVSR